MALEKDDAATDAGTIEPLVAEIPAKPERAEREREPLETSETKPKSLRATLKAAVKEHAPETDRLRRLARGEAPKVSRETGSPETEDASKDGAPATAKEIPRKDDGKEPATAPQALVATPAPAALSKEVKAIWDKLDPAVRNEFLRREADSTKGVEQIKAKYRGYDEALSPLQDELKSVGKTEAEGIRMLADWRRALSGPNKVQAFAALARLENVDLSQLVPRSPQGAAPQQQPNPNDPANILRPYIDPLRQEITGLKSQLQTWDQQRVQSDIQSFSKDKPHFEKVRVQMGYLMNSGLVPGANAREVFDEAYSRACRADPEVFALITQEDQAKREAETRTAQEAAAKKAADAEAERKRRETEEVAKARRAAVGPRGGSPAGMATANKVSSQSVGDSLRAAIKEVRTAI